MAISMSLKEYLTDVGVAYELLKHTPTQDSTHTAEVAHIPSEQLAKAVMLEDEDGRYLLAIIPSNQHIDLGKLHREFNVHMGLATEIELGEIFDDCAPGAVPAVGEAYGIDVMLDSSLDDCSEVYFESGDHIHLVHLSGEDYQRLIPRAIHTQFTTN